MKKYPKTHTFNGISYDLHWGEIDGMCDSPGRGSRPNFVVAMEADNSLKFLETVIHEAMHASDWQSSENKVTITARDIARLLKRLGYEIKE